jgi:surface protein
MARMFQGCNALPSLNVSSFDTSWVISMVNMFAYMPDTELRLGADFYISWHATNFSNIFTINEDNTQVKSRSTIDMYDCSQEMQDMITSLTSA